jgi:hypothetical protein
MHEKGRHCYNNVNFQPVQRCGNPGSHATGHLESHQDRQVEASAAERGLLRGHCVGRTSFSQSSDIPQKDSQYMLQALRIRSPLSRLQRPHALFQRLRLRRSHHGPRLPRRNHIRPIRPLSACSAPLPYLRPQGKPYVRILPTRT